MALSEQDITRIEGLIGAEFAAGELQRAFRAEFPGLMLTQVDEGDVDTVAPYRTYDEWLLYFVDDQHCRQIISDPSHAAGVVLARRRRRRA